MCPKIEERNETIKREYATLRRLGYSYKDSVEFLSNRRWIIGEKYLFLGEDCIMKIVRLGGQGRGGSKYRGIDMY